MNNHDELQDSADKAFELLEQKSPHQLAVELASLQRKHGIAVSALNKIGAQRDQLAVQLNDATAQCGVMADLLRELREGAEIHLHNCTVCKNEVGSTNWTDKLARIDAALAGKLPERFIVVSGKLSEMTTEELSRLQLTGPIIRRKNAPTDHHGLLDWAVTRWHEQVANRPMENIYRRTLDSVWRQVIRFAGEDPQSLIGPSHDDLLHGTQQSEGGEL